MNLPTFSMAAAVVGLLALAGCTSPKQAQTELSPRLLADVHQAPTDKRRPTVALVLGGGGLRGFAHVGVLKALEEAGVRPDIVVGTSAGSVVGAAYASGMSVEAIKNAAQTVRVSSLIDLTFSTSGLIRGNNIAGWINGLTQEKPIEHFPIRFATVATDLQSGRAVLINSGSAGRAVQASSAVPGVNVPVVYPNGQLIDGGVTSLVPVRFARAMGATIVIAVDIYCHSPRSDGLSAPSVLSKVMQTQSCLVAAQEMAEADVLIAPVVKSPSMSERDSQEAAMQAGYEAAKAALIGWRSDEPHL